MKRIKKFLAGMLAMTCAFSALSMTACEFNVDEVIDKVKEELPFDDDKADETPDDGTDEEPSETPDDGTDDGAGDNTDEPTSGGNIAMTDSVQYLRAGGTYALSKSVAFLSTDVEATSSTYTPVTSTLTAKVEPIDADQRVDWTYEFVNASSTWAKGKTLTDYMTIAPKSDGSTELAVTCKKSFGEPIKITCTSRANNNISASTVVDFLAVPELQTVVFSNSVGGAERMITVNLGGETVIPFDDLGQKQYGGQMSVGEYKASTASVYTRMVEIDDYDVFSFDLVQPEVFYDHSATVYESVLNGTTDDGYLTADVSGVLSNVVNMMTTVFINDLGIKCKLGCTSEFWTSDILGNMTYATKAQTMGAGIAIPSINSLDECDEEDIIAILDTISENSLYTFVLHTEIGGAAKTYYSLMKLEIV